MPYKRNVQHPGQREIKNLTVATVIKAIPDGTTTPSVTDEMHIEIENTVAVTITDFIGVPAGKGQILYTHLKDGVTSFGNDGTKLNILDMPPGVDWGPGNLDEILKWYHDGTTWNLIEVNKTGAETYTIKDLDDGDTTPDITNVSHIRTNNTTPTTITNFTGKGSKGQIVYTHIGDDELTSFGNDPTKLKFLDMPPGVDWGPGNFEEILKWIHDGTRWVLASKTPTAATISPIKVIEDGETEPDVTDVTDIVIENTAPTTITNFVGGKEGKVIYVHIADDQKSTFGNDPTKLKFLNMPPGVNWGPGNIDEILKWQHDGTKWIYVG